MPQCLFCNIDRDPIVSNEKAFAVYDHYPVSPGHMLVIPKRHIDNIFKASEEEVIAIHFLILECKKVIESKYKPDGYNVGTNIGIAGGQSIFHLHYHIIPRYEGDIDEPLGGIRNVVPHKCPHKKK